MAAVYGPIAPQQIHREQAEGATVSVLIKSGKSVNNNSSAASGGGGVGALVSMEAEWVAWLTSILSAAIDTAQHPRTVIEIVLQIIQDDGSVLGSLLHAAVAALMDAGVELLYLPVATTCLVVVTEGDSAQQKQQQPNHVAPSQPLQKLLDPTLAEEEQENTSLVVIVNQGTAGGAKSDQFLACHSMGSTTLPLVDMLSCIPLAAHASPAVAAFWRLAVEQKVTRESQTLWSK
jgi:hypothetical protein